MPFPYFAITSQMDGIKWKIRITDFYERNTVMETDLFDFAYVPDWYGQLEELEGMGTIWGIPA